MHLYYKKSALTIAIDSAQEDQEGFLHLGRKNDPPVAVFPFPSAAVNHRAYSYFRRLTPSLSKLLAKSPVNKILLRRLGKQDKDELSGRGWTLQETILSPRTVHYSASELKWACQKNMISERNLGLPVTLPFIKKGFLSLSNRVSENEMLRYGSGSRIYEKWYIILDDYQRRALSVSSDRLPAISGLAREFASHISTTYKAGIWLEDLHLGLLWSYFGRGVKPGFYRAPSWSWAAMDYSAVEKADDSNYSELFGWSRGSTDPEVTNSNAEVVSCEVILKDNDPYGAVLGGELILRAFWITWPRKKLWPWDELWSLPPIVDDGFGTINRMSAGKIVCIFDERPKEKSTYDDPDFFLDVSLVLIFRAKSEHYSLLLKPVEGEGNEGKFVKIGVALLPYELDEIEMAESGWVKRDISII
jgi:hypothetical protein